MRHMTATSQPPLSSTHARQWADVSVADSHTPAHLCAIKIRCSAHAPFAAHAWHMVCTRPKKRVAIPNIFWVLQLAVFTYYFMTIYLIILPPRPTRSDSRHDVSRRGTDHAASFSSIREARRRARTVHAAHQRADGPRLPSCRDPTGIGTDRARDEHTRLVAKSSC